MNSKPPIYISLATINFSGATLLSFLLATHPQITSIGEMSGLIPRVNPDKYLCSCGQKIKECEFWQSVKIAMANRAFEFDVAHFDTKFNLNGPRFVQRLRQGIILNGPLDSLRNAISFMLPSEARQYQAMTDRNVAFIESVLEVTDKSVFVDSSKGTFRLKVLRHFSSLDVRAIHLVRDVRGFVASRLRRDLNRNLNTDAATAARVWTRTHRSVEVALRNWPEEKYMRVHYEDLCQETEDSLKRIHNFCGVDTNHKFEDFRAAPHHIIGNEMRLRSESKITLDERWKNELTADQLKEIERIAGPVAHQYGYFS